MHLKGPESFSPLVDRFFDNRLLKVSPQRPHVCCRCHGNCRWFSTALNLLLARAHELIKCNCLCQKITDAGDFLMKPCQKVIGVRVFWLTVLDRSVVVTDNTDIAIDWQRLISTHDSMYSMLYCRHLHLGSNNLYLLLTLMNLFPRSLTFIGLLHITALEVSSFHVKEKYVVSFTRLDFAPQRTVYLFKHVIMQMY